MKKKLLTALAGAVVCAHAGAKAIPNSATDLALDECTTANAIGADYLGAVNREAAPSTTMMAALEKMQALATRYEGKGKPGETMGELMSRDDSVQFEAVSNLIREVFAVTPAYDDEGQMATFSSGVAAINTGFDAERPRWAYLSVYVISWNKEDPDARQVRFLVSDRGQTLRRREGAVNVGGQAGRSWPDALERLRTKIHEVMVEFFGQGPADAFMVRHRTQLSPRRFDPEAGLKVRELVDKLKR